MTLLTYPVRPQHVDLLPPGRPPGRLGRLPPLADQTRLEAGGGARPVGSIVEGEEGECECTMRGGQRAEITWQGGRGQPLVNLDEVWMLYESTKS